jgi:excisionase family DNA binding protein
MRTSTSRLDPPDEWLTVQEASALIGVSRATLRRWSDAGQVTAYTTPGGHRRFARSTLVALLPPSPEDRPTPSHLEETAERMTGAYRRGMPTVRASLPWIDDLDDAAVQPLREHGQRIAAALLAVLDAPTRRAGRASLRVAASSAAACAGIAAACGVGREEVVEAFLRLRMLFLQELVESARLRGYDTVRSTDLVMTAATFFDDLLLVLVRDRQEDVPEVSTS